jgi:hypothetical protein
MALYYLAQRKRRIEPDSARKALAITAAVGFPIAIALDQL